MLFAIKDCTEKTLIFRNGNVVCLCSGNHINKSMHRLPDHFLAGSDIILIKVGQTFCQNNEEKDVRVY